jgi:hypothetical protein
VNTNNRNTKHTPGPWVAESRHTQKFDPRTGAKLKPEVLYSVMSEGGEVITAFSNIVNKDAEANARLIAAAPELLEWALKIRETFPITKAPDGWSPQWSRDLDALIAKATGGAE